MNIGIIGQGFVGTALNEGLAKHYKIETYDIAKASTCESIEELAIKSDIIFVCLPTPMNSDGSCNLNIVESVIKELNVIGNYLVVIKSTIPPGTTEKFNNKYKNIDIVFNP